MAKLKGPQFVVYISPILEVLKSMGGAGKTAEVIDRVIDFLKISDKEVEQSIPSGGSRVRNRIQWARLYLSKGGLLDSSEHGVWRLTEKGWSSTLNADDVNKLYRVVQDGFNSEKKKIDASKEGNKIIDVDDETIEDEKHTGSLIDIIMRLSPAGFEKLSKRLLTECGFQNVEVTGKSGDGGIDGIGLLAINDLVTFKVLFQCKRYKETVSPSQVRDFRGAMGGRADKGIIITSGRFTQDAKREATRDGVPPIELVDGEKLVELFEKYKLGVKPKVVFDIDYGFFEEFK